MANSALHDALRCLRPKDFSEVPVDSLDGFMRDVFANAELIVNSVPQPPGGTDFRDSKRKRTDVNGARSASEMTVSDARAPPFDPSFEDLPKAWGKPLKTSNNPLAVSVYKMAGADRYGSWFARRSVHEGLGFTKWKRALQREFAESLAVEGGPGSGAVRGVGGDKKLEKEVVDGLGRLEVLRLSAKFPAPTAPREFITMILTSDNALGEKSKPHLDDGSEITKQIPRHYIIVSIPCEHPDAPQQSGLVRGQYESVEIIREIPLVPSKPKGSDSETTERKEEASPDDPEANPVEWIMITRSDPGGGIPRFMVDRGTPGSIVADTSKFLDWACAKDEIPDPEKDESLQAAQEMADETPEAEEAQPRASFSAASRNAQLAGVGTSIADLPLTGDKKGSSPNGSGFMSSLTSAVGNGIQNYAPQSVASYLQPNSQPSTPSSDSASDDNSSILSFASAEQWATAAEAPPESAIPALGNSTESLDSAMTKTASSGQSRYDKELSKIDAKRAELDEKLRKTREKEQARTQQNSEREEREKRKAEEKYEREMAKLQAKREKEARKLEQRRKKEEDKNVATRMQRERDEFKSRAEMAERENRLLKEQVGELQNQNTLLVQKLGKTDVGQAALKAVSEDLRRARSGSGSSGQSKSSKKSMEGKPAV